MCDNVEKFVVPKRPAARSGWWIGRKIEDGSKLPRLRGGREEQCRVLLLWAQNFRAVGRTVSVFESDLEEFNTLRDATECVKKKGAEVQLA